jgi:hypothetical protein
MTAEQNYFAFIKDDSGSCQIKRIRVNQTLQTELCRIFDNQKLAFENGVDTEIEFNGDWKPESNEVLTVNDLTEARTMIDAINANASSFSDVVISNFSNEPIKAIFTGSTSSNVTTVYVQKFTSRQALSLNELPILKMQTGNTFVKTTEDLFTLDNKLVAIIQGTQTKFKSFHNARMVFDLSEQYKEATDEDLNELSLHDSLEISDVSEFISNADNQVRKMAHTITKLSVLDTYSVADISTAANNFPKVKVTVNNGKLVLPTDKGELKEVLHFLLEDIYKGPLSGSSYLTNSKRSI